jgi:hypothetical protein
MQFPHVNDTPLYTPNIKPNSSFTNQKYILAKVCGKKIIISKKKLTQQMQQKKAYNIVNYSIIYKKEKNL